MDLVLPCLTAVLADALVLPTDGANCSCTIFLVQILLIRPWPNVQHTINLCRGWVKELSLSELSRSDAWTTSLQKPKTQEWMSHRRLYFLGTDNTFFVPFFEGLYYII